MRHPYFLLGVLPWLLILLLRLGPVRVYVDRFIAERPRLGRGLRRTADWILPPEGARR